MHHSTHFYGKAEQHQQQFGRICCTRAISTLSALAVYTCQCDLYVLCDDYTMNCTNRKKTRETQQTKNLSNKKEIKRNRKEKVATYTCIDARKNVPNQKMGTMHCADSYFTHTCTHTHKYMQFTFGSMHKWLAGCLISQRHILKNRSTKFTHRQHTTPHRIAKNQYFVVDEHKHYG